MQIEKCFSSNVETTTSVKMQITRYYTGYLVLVSALKCFHEKEECNENQDER